MHGQGIAARNPVGLGVRDLHDRGLVRAAEHRKAGRRSVDRTEPGRDLDQALLRERLTAEQQHAVPLEGAQDRMDDLRGGITCQIDLDLGAERAAALADPRRVHGVAMLPSRRSSAALNAAGFSCCTQ